MDLQELEIVCMVLIDLTQKRDRWWALVTVVTNFRVT